MLRRILQISRPARLYSQAAPGASSPKVVSSVPAGTVLKGCNVRKSGQDPVALADEEYPAWLWEILDPEAQQRKLEANPTAYARKQRREANRKRIKDNNFLAKMKA